MSAVRPRSPSQEAIRASSSSHSSKVVRITFLVIGILLMAWGKYNLNSLAGYCSLGVGGILFVVGLIWTIVVWCKERKIPETRIEESRPEKYLILQKAFENLTPEEATINLFTVIEHVGVRVRCIENYVFTKEELIQEFFFKGANLNEVNTDENSLYTGKTPIEIAYLQRDQSMVRKLLDLGAETTNTDILAFSKQQLLVRGDNPEDPTRREDPEFIDSMRIQNAARQLFQTLKTEISEHYSSDFRYDWIKQLLEMPSVSHPTESLAFKIVNATESLTSDSTPIDIAYDVCKDKKLVQLLLEKGAVTTRQEILEFARQY